jgi:hypothetical protein
VSDRRDTAAGCTPPEERCAGGLPDLVRPRFYPGQVLTDRDLGDLGEWVRARLALVRLRDGWGVVCGLAVSAAARDPSKVTVGSGYAVDRAGNDLVLRDAVAAPLPRPTDPQVRDCTLLSSRADPVAMLSVGPFRVPLRDLAVFDVAACHTVEGDSPVTAPGCRPQPRCEYSRTREAVKVSLAPVPLDKHGKPVAPEADPADDPAAALLGAFVAAFPGLAKWKPPAVAGALPADPPALGKAPNRWLADYLRANPGPFPAWQDWLKEETTGRELSTPWGAARALFWLTEAARRTTAGCPPAPCPCPDAGVTLGRVWAVRSGSAYTVRFVSTASTHRRVFGPDTGSGPLSVRAQLGRPFEEIHHDLRAAQVTVVREPFEIPADAEHLRQVYAAEAALKGRFTPGGKFFALEPSPTDNVVTPYVVAFGKDRHNALTDLTGTPLAVEFYPPDSKAEDDTPPQFADPAALGKPLDVRAVPADAAVRVAVRTEGRLTAEAKAVYLHDELTGMVRPLGAAEPAKAIVAHVRLPGREAAAGARVTVIAADRPGEPERVTALAGTTPVPLMRAPLTGDFGPKLAIAGRTATVGGTEVALASPVYLLAGGTLPEVRVGGTVQMSNPSPSKVTVSLQRTTKAAPAEADWGAAGEVEPVPASTPADKTNLAKLDAPLGPDHAVSYRVRGKDEFLREFTAGPVSFGVTVRDEKLAAKVTNKADAEGKSVTAALVLTNQNTEKGVTVLAVTGTPLAPPGLADVTLDKLGLTIDKAPAGGGADSKALVMRADPTKVTQWRLAVEYKLDGEADQRKAFGEFKATDV